MAWKRYADCVRLNARILSLLVAGRWLRREGVAHSYDRLAPDYDENWLVHLRDTTARLLDRIPLNLPEGSVLDLGCGTGFASRRLAAHYPGRPVEASDVSDGMIGQARLLPGTAGISWHVADMVDFLAARTDRSAALIVAAWSVGYSDYRRVFLQSRRVLCPGGRFAFVVNLADTLAPLRRAFRYCMQAHASELRCLARFPFPRDAAALRAALHTACLEIELFEEGECAIEAPATTDGRQLPWLLRTGTLAGFDAMLPLDRPGPVADTFEARLAADAAPLRHHYALGVAVRP